MKNEYSTKEKILKAFAESKTKTVADVCSRVGVTPAAFYFHYYKDSDFKKKVLEKRREKLAAQIEATA